MPAQSKLPVCEIGSEHFLKNQVLQMIMIFYEQQPTWGRNTPLVYYFTWRLLPFNDPQAPATIQMR